jgi:hypothetical protein
MFWSRRGAHAILQARCSILSGRFDADWEEMTANRATPRSNPAA